MSTSCRLNIRAKARPVFTTLAVLYLFAPARLPADEVIAWNNVLLDTIRMNSMSPLNASRIVAAMHTGMYDAVNSIARTHQPYHVDMTADPGTSREAAAAQAAHHVLSGLVPASQASYDAALANSLSSVPDGPGKTAGIALGNTVGAAILALRANDGASVVEPYTPGTGPGQWRPTPPANSPAGAPQWAKLTPWAMTSPSQFRNPDGPPALDTPEYTAAFNQVREIGSATSATRTQDQSDIAHFWVSPTGTSTPPGHWNRIAQTVAESHGNTLEENARLFALLGMAQADAGVSAWDNKYYYNDWRPVTAIREAETDGNDDTVADPNWNSFITTPNHPSYSSGHATVSGASGAVLADFFGTDNVSFTSSPEGLIVPDRSYTSFSQASTEASNSRLYGGIHWSYDNADGLAGGRELGHYVYSARLRPTLPSGDFNSDGQINAADIDALSQAVRSGGSPQPFDLNGDGGVDGGDRTVWIQQIRKAYLGDANLDGEFGSADLTMVFQAGEYEDSATLNSTWATGDWDGDGDFTTGDIVLAFQDGGYEQGPRAAVSAVPEPASFVMLVVGLIGMAVRRRHVGP